MGFEFRLPDIGEGVVEGEIVKWLVKIGDSVDIDQPMVEVMTDKATVVISSPRAGVVRETRAAEGDVAPVGSVIVVIDEPSGGETRGRPSSSEASKPSETSGAPSAPAGGSDPSARAGGSNPSAASTSGSAPVAAPLAGNQDPIRAAPATRRLARESGVDLSTIAGTGPAGRITSDDVRRAQTSRASTAPHGVSAPAAPAALDVADNDQVVPVRGVRRRIWDGMTRSAFTAPHFTFVEECDMTEMVGYRARLNGVLNPDEGRLSFLPFIVKAVCSALRDFPELNGQVDEQGPAFARRSSRHIGIAVAADQGLTVPVVRHADRWSLVGLAREIKRLSDAVRGGTVNPKDLGGSTFTITSLGKDGGLWATPILNYPEVGILGVHRLQRRPMVPDGEDRVVIRDMMNLSLSCDHRWVDGHVAARFTYRLIELLEKPDRLVVEMGGAG